MSKVRELSLAYYTAVDSGDVEAVLDCFSDDAVYRRPGYEPIVGREGLRDFYSGVRVIDSGAHEVQDIVVEGDRSAIRCRFVGRLKDGSAAEVGFADFFGFAGDHIATRTGIVAMLMQVARDPPRRRPRIADTALAGAAPSARAHRPRCAPPRQRDDCPPYAPAPRPRRCR